MLRLPRSLPAILLACATALPLAYRANAADETPATPAPATPAPATPAPATSVPDATPATPAPATPAPATPAPAPATPDATATPATPGAEAQPLDPALVKHTEDFWHYGKIAKYELAAGEGNEILKLNAQPVDVLRAFDLVTGATGGPNSPGSLRNDDATAWLLRWQQNDKMKDVAIKLLGVLEDGRRKRNTDPIWIRQNIEGLSINERAFARHLADLRQAGELSVPYMIDYLRDGSKKPYHPAIRRALVELGRMALNPLVASTEMKDPETLVIVCSVLGSGYSDAAPYLARLVAGADTNGAVKQAATAALNDLTAGNAKSVNAASLFYDLGDRFYYGNSSITPDLKAHVAYIWYWDETKGLTKKDVPPTIFGDVMAMRSAEYALKLDPSKGDAISLWLASNFKREADLAAPDAQAPGGGVDTTREPGQPTADFYAFEAGVKYVEQVVDRALRDRNSAVALAAIKALEKIAGQANLFDDAHQPIIDALNYPDRVVRFEAAGALAGALPTKSFAGQDQVVPILADSLLQNGKSTALVLAADQDQYNALSEQLKLANYASNGGTSADDAIAKALRMPGIDVVIIAEEATQPQRDRMEQLLQQNLKLQRTARLFITATKSATPYAARSAIDPLVNVTTAKDAAGLGPALQAARQRSGALPLDDKMATDYALKSAALLAKLAINHGTVLDLTVAQPALLSSLEDTRPDVVKAVAIVLGMVNAKDVQVGLVNKAVDEKTPDDVKIALFKSAATNARSFGNQLDAAQVDGLTKVVESVAGPDVRGAAAEAFGALNLPPDKARGLILQQSHTSPFTAPAATP